MLAEYDQHARITGGDPEQMLDAAAAAYLALTLDGTDTLLMAADHALRRELSRRIREDLIRLGVVQPGPAVRIAGGATVSAGDLIICTQNDHTVQAGEPGRTLANGDLLRIEAVTPDGLVVRRALDADPRTGQRRWTNQHFLHAKYGNAELGYAVTDHVAQGGLDWQCRASSIGAWRELSGYDHPADPIGPEPAAAAPDMRAAWHEAFAALAPVDGPDVRGMPDGTLLHLRDTYPIETA